MGHGVVRTAAGRLGGSRGGSQEEKTRPDAQLLPLATARGPQRPYVPRAGAVTILTVARAGIVTIATVVRAGAVTIATVVRAGTVTIATVVRAGALL